ncbi:MAG: hypothetical protein WCH44_06300 [Betaproteobacteria bacterium]
MKRLTAFTALLALTLSASAQIATSFFSVNLGQAIDGLPNCKTPEGASKICYHTPIGKRAGAPYYIELRPEHPSFLKGNLMTTVEAGAITSVVVETTGVKSQDEIIKYLTAAYGKPSSIEFSELQNSFGARFKVATAAWPFKGGIVLFVGANDKIDSGYIDYRH